MNTFNNVKATAGKGCRQEPEAGQETEAGLEQSPFRERQRRSAGDYEVVQDFDVHQGQRLFQGHRQCFIRTAGLGYAAWVVVGQDNGCGIVP